MINLTPILPDQPLNEVQDTVLGGKTESCEWLNTVGDQVMPGLKGKRRYRTLVLEDHEKRVEGD